MNAPSLPVRAALFLVGAILAGVAAAVVSTVAPDPYPFAVGLAVAIPVMDAALYPGNVPDDRERAVRVGVLAALAGVVAGCVASVVVRPLALGESVTIGLVALVTYLAATYGGRWLTARIPRS